MADKTISGLPALATVSKEDILLVVDNPAGTPLNRKISIENFFSNVEPVVFFSNTKSASGSQNASVVFKGGVGIMQNLIIDGDVEIRGATISGTTKIGAINDDIVLTTDDLFDLANTSNTIRTIYAGNFAAGLSGTINVNSNTTIFNSNTVFNSSNVHINGTHLNVHSNTSFYSNVKINSSVDNFSINSDNLLISSDIITSGNNFNIDSNISLTKSFIQTGILSLFDTNQFIANSDNFVVYGNVVIGLWASDGNPKGTTKNVYISATNTYMKTDLTVKGTRSDYYSNLYVHSVNTSVNSTNTYFRSNFNVKGNTVFVGNIKSTSNLFFINSTNNYFSGSFTSKNRVSVKTTSQSTNTSTGSLVLSGGAGIARNVYVGGNLNISGKTTFEDNFISNGPILEVNSNTELKGSNTFIMSGNTFIKSNNFIVYSNTHILSDLNSTDSSTGSLVVDGGLGVAKDTTVGGNLNVTGNIHAIGNITANGSIVLGDQSSDRLSLVARVESDILPASHQTFSIGRSGLRFANGWFKNVYVSSNVQIDDSLWVRGKESKLQANVFVIGPEMQTTSNNYFNGKLFNVYGQNAHVTSNLTIQGTNTVITANLTLTNSKIQLNSDEMVVNSNFVFGKDSDTSKNIIFYGSSSGEKVKYDPAAEQLILNSELILNSPLKTENKILMSNDQSFIFRKRLHTDYSDLTYGALLSENDDFIVMEDNSTDGILSTDYGIHLRTRNLLFGRGDIYTGEGSSNIFIFGDGRSPHPLQNGTLPLPEGQSHLYSKPENIKNSSNSVVDSGSYLHTLTKEGFESVLGMHNDEGDLEFISRNLNTGETFRLNIFELARAVEQLVGNGTTYIREE